MGWQSFTLKQTAIGGDVLLEIPRYHLELEAQLNTRQSRLCDVMKVKTVSILIHGGHSHKEKLTNLRYFIRDKYLDLKIITKPCIVAGPLDHRASVTSDG